MITRQFTSLRRVAISAGWRAIVCIVAMCAITLAVTSTPRARAASTVTQCNGVDNQGGREVHCTVQVDIATDTITVTSCTGFANAIETCIGPTASTSSLTAIDQCNGSGNGGGAVVKCDVIVTGAPAGGAVTISQCIGSGQGGGTQPTIVCIPGSTPNDTSAQIQQCNSSGNGGGGTERVKCSVAPASALASLPTINQCNGSANGGGAYVTCTVTISVATAATATSTPGSTTTATAGGGSVTPTAGAATGTAIAGTATATPIAGSSTPATAGGGSVTPTAGGTTPPIRLAPNVGSGPAGGANVTGVSLFTLTLVTLGLSAIGSATIIRRRYSPTRAGSRVRRAGDDSPDA